MRRVDRRGGAWRAIPINFYLPRRESATRKRRKNNIRLDYTEYQAYRFSEEQQLLPLQARGARSCEGCYAF